MTAIVENVTQGLILVVGVILVGSYLYSRMFGLQIKGSKGFIKMITSASIGPKKSIAIVSVGTQYLVLGITPDSITYLTSIESLEGIENLEAGIHAKDISGFKGILNTIKKNFRNSAGLKQ
ncbi:MAG: flagellar biosynthetic protein FliO [Deltaproteobacteria bacterium]|nr:flagellar biosynthetic protein FliO [Deltaproteobacteria bacterium]